jgi:hypothetical protein
MLPQKAEQASLGEGRQEFRAWEIDHSFYCREVSRVLLIEVELGLSGGELQEGTMGEWGEAMKGAGDGLFAAVALAGEQCRAEVRSDVTHLAVQP